LSAELVRRVAFSRRTRFKLVGALALVAAGHLTFWVAWVWPLYAVLPLLWGVVAVALTGGRLLWGRRPENWEQFGHGLVSLTSALVLALGLWSGNCFLYGRIEWRMAPLVAAIGKYEAQRGSLPEKRADLVPTYLPAIPRCPYDTMTDIALGMGGLGGSGDGAWGGGWHIICGTFFIQRYSYDHEHQRWYTWD
jgi:hypothetical protein